MKQKRIYEMIVTLAVTFIFIMPVNAIAFNEKSMDDEPYTMRNPENLDFTHTVFAESATATTCGYCKYSHAALKTIYASGDYPFYYVSLVTDKNSKALTRATADYNVHGYPTVFFDGGYIVNLGGGTGNEAQYRSSIITCGDRSVSDIDINLVVAWRGGTEMDIAVSVYNNEISTYNGFLRVYITEFESSMGWTDSGGYLYTFPFLDWAFNEEISIPAGDMWGDIVNWNGSVNGFPSITKDNILVIASVFNDEWHQGYAYPPSGNPFNAYYVDEVNAAIPTNGSGSNIPPYKPNTPSGPQSGIMGIEYTYISSTTDIEEDEVFYLFDWADGTNSGWIGPYNSGDSAEASHAWIKEGVYDIKVKAKDIHGAESGWSKTLTVHISDEPKPILEINDIYGDLFKASVVIKNIGLREAISVDWNILLTGGMILLGKETSGKLVSIPAGEEKTISSSLIFGFGKTLITATVECDESSDAIEQNVLVLLFFIREI